VDLAIFRDMGLEDREANVYLSLLGTGPSRASLVAKRTRIERSVVYKVLGRLVDKKFVNYYVRENRRYFQAKDPMELTGLLEERKKRFEEALPELQKMKKPVSEEIKAEVFRGREGIVALLNDILREVGDLRKELRLVFGMGEIMATLESAGPFYQNWVDNRVGAGIKWMYLANRASHEKLVHEPLFENYFLSEGMDLPMSMIIYGEKVLTFYPGLTGEGFVGTLTESKEVATEKSEFFLRLWRHAKREFEH